METIAQFIGRLANKAGIPNDDPNLVNILSNADISKVTIPSELISGIDNKLLSIEQAKDNHPAIKSKYHAEALNAIDARIAAVIEESGFAPEKATELKGIKSTYERFEALTNAIREASAAKQKPSEDKSALQKQVDDLLLQMKAVKTDAETKISDMQRQRESDKISYEMRSMLGGFKTIFDELPAAKQAALESLISKALGEKEASFAFDENGAFILKGKGDTAVVGANNAKYTPQSFLEEVFAQNKVLKVSEPEGAKTTTQPARIHGETANKGNSQQVALNMSVLENFQKQTAASA